MSRLSFCGQIGSYFTTTSGATDFFEIFHTGAHWVQTLSPESGSKGGVLDCIKNMSADGSSFMAWPVAFAEGAKFIDALCAKEFFDPNPEKVQKAWDSAFVQGADFVNRGCKAAMHLHAREWIHLGGASFPILDGIYNATSLYSDVASFNELLQKMYTEEDPWLPLLKLVRDIASIAMAALGLLALVIEAAFGVIFLMPPVTLGLSTIYISAKISAVFYERMCFEPA